MHIKIQFFIPSSAKTFRRKKIVFLSKSDVLLLVILMKNLIKIHGLNNVRSVVKCSVVSMIDSSCVLVYANSKFIRHT